mgnify:CR=1 FL=1
MKVIETYLKGCFIIEPPVFKDKRGSFMVCFDQQQFQEKTGVTTTFVLDNQSISDFGGLRGLHMQKDEYSQVELVIVTQGKVLDVVVDVTKNSPTYGDSFSMILSSEDNNQSYIPEGFLHIFSIIEDNTVFSNICDNYYNTDAKVGVVYNDSDLNIDWVLKEDEVILSEKDKSLIDFREFRRL